MKVWHQVTIGRTCFLLLCSGFHRMTIFACRDDGKPALSYNFMEWTGINLMYPDICSIRRGHRSWNTLFLPGIFADVLHISATYIADEKMLLSKRCPLVLMKIALLAQMSLTLLKDSRGLPNPASNVMFGVFIVGQDPTQIGELINSFDLVLSNYQTEAIIIPIDISNPQGLRFGLIRSPILASSCSNLSVIVRMTNFVFPRRGMLSAKSKSARRPSHNTESQILVGASSREWRSRSS